jgi:hypothetical protein
MKTSSRRIGKGASLLVSTLLAAGLVTSAQHGLGQHGSGMLIHAKLTSGSGLNENLSANQSPTWQTNGTVWSLAYSNGVVYAGGAFTSVRPPGSPLGTNEEPVSYLTSFNSSDGSWTGWSPTVNGTVYAVAVSPDGSTVYAGGTFTSADGVAVHNLAAFNTTTGALITSFKPNVNAKVTSIAVSPDGSTVYFGGSFSKVDTVARTDGAAVQSVSAGSPGALLAFDPVLNGSVATVAVAPDDSRVLMGGWFTSVNGVTQQALASLDPTTGASDEWDQDIIPNYPGCVSDTKDIIISDVTGTMTAYIADEGTGPGCFDGDWAANLYTGRLIWQNDCLGATQTLAIVNGWLYKGSHAHDCAYSPGGFPQVSNASGWVTHHLLDQSLVDGSLGHFVADTNAPGGVEPLGPGTMTTDGTQLFVGGDFTTVNGQPQQGFTRFAPGPDTTTPTRPIAPVVTSPYAGTDEVSFQASSDPDDGTLTYEIYRSGTKNPIGSLQATSWFWSLPVLHFMDTGLMPGKTYTYQVTASDGTNTSSKSPPSNSVTVSSTSPTESYDQTVESLTPNFFWPLNDPPGSTTAQDLSGNGFNGVYETSGVAPGTTTGPLAGSSDAAPIFDGSSGLVSSANSVNNPEGFTIEGWFETTTKDGGMIVGFGNNQTGWSSNYDRHVYMMNDGQIVFGVWTGQTETIESRDAYNDGRWHFFVASQDPTNGMSLYVDGQLVGTNATTSAQPYAGFWRVGGDNLNGWSLDPWGGNSQGTTEPLSYYFGGSIADVAEFPYALSQSQVQDQYAAALYAPVNG